MGDVLRNKIHGVDRGQVLKIFRYQLNCLHPILEAVQDLNLGNNMSKIVFLNENSWLIVENRSQKRKRGHLGDCLTFQLHNGENLINGGRGRDGLEEQMGEMLGEKK